MCSVANAEPYNRYPSRFEISEMAKSLVLKYPVLKDPITNEVWLLKRVFPVLDIWQVKAVCDSKCSTTYECTGDSLAVRYYELANGAVDTSLKISGFLLPYNILYIVWFCNKCLYTAFFAK